MIGRRAAIGITMLCALISAASVAPGASAAGTTAVTCAKSKGGGFSDAHCTKEAKAGEGTFGHVAIEPKKETQITVTNQNTSEETKGSQTFLLTGELAGAKFEIPCSGVGGTGTLTNEEVEGSMRASGNLTIETSGCKVLKPTGCAIQGGTINYNAHFNTQGMELEFTPKSGGQFGTWTLINNGAEKCPVTGVIGISGSFLAIPSGATLGLTTESTKNLKWGTNPYAVTASLTLRMKEGNPIAFTT
jgi:hypothetical protein